jgi:hypothetical protein
MDEAIGWIANVRAAAGVGVGVVAGLVTLAGFVPYILSIRRGEAKPNRATWWIWTIACGALFASYYASGERSALWVPLSYVLGPLIIGALSLKHGEGGWTKFDLGCVGASVLGLLAWGLSGSPLVALVANMGVDLAGAMPTIRKTYRNPTSESSTAWTFFFVGSALNLFAVETWASAASMLPIYFFGVNGTIMVLALRRPPSPPIREC